MNIITANRTRDGIVVYWTGHAWSLRLTDAALLDDEAAAKAQENFSSEEITVVAPEIEPVSAVDELPRVRLRETIRANGPTIDWRPLVAPVPDVSLR